MPTLADIYSAADSFKRRLADVVQNPGLSLQQMVGYANDRARAFNELNAQAAQESRETGQMFGPKMRELGDVLASAYNPTGMISKVNYGISHRPPTIEQGAARLHDLTAAFDDTIYSKAATQNYGTGSPLDKEAIRIFQAVRNKPNAMITVYRAIPKDVADKGINVGDWVTISKQYAMEHGEGTLQGKYKIVSQKIPAKDLTTNADSILEQGYYPER